MAVIRQRVEETKEEAQLKIYAAIAQIAPALQSFSENPGLLKKLGEEAIRVHALTKEEIKAREDAAALVQISEQRHIELNEREQKISDWHRSLQEAHQGNLSAIESAKDRLEKEFNDRVAAKNAELEAHHNAKLKLLESSDSDLLKREEGLSSWGSALKNLEASLAAKSKELDDWEATLGKQKNRLDNFAKELAGRHEKVAHLEQKAIVGG